METDQAGLNQEMVAQSPSARRIAASYPNYLEAQRAVDYLSDEGFPVERTAIVGEGLQIVEEVTGRRGWAQVLLSGALGGGMVGVFFGFLFGIFNWVDPLISGLWLAVNGLVIGAIIGAVFGLIFYAISGGRRDFSSVQGLRAEQYNVMVDDEVYNEAYRMLQNLDSAPASARS